VHFAKFATLCLDEDNMSLNNDYEHRNTIELCDRVKKL